jgi:Ribonuclease G/E
MIFTNCPRCRGTGRVRTIESRAGAILRRLGAALALKGFTKVEVRAPARGRRPPEAQLRDALPRSSRSATSARSRSSQCPIRLEDSVLRYLRADGPRGAPGGRRKR